LEYYINFDYYASNVNCKLTKFFSLLQIMTLVLALTHRLTSDLGSGNYTFDRK